MTKFCVKLYIRASTTRAWQKYENTRRGTPNFGIGRFRGFGNCPWAVNMGFGIFG